MSKTLKWRTKHLIAASLLTLLTACSSGGSSSKEKPETSKGVVENKTFSFSIEKPTFNTSGNQTSQLILPLLIELKRSMFNQAFAADDVLTSNIHIVKVNAFGEIIAIMQPTTPITQQADKSYKVSIDTRGESNIVLVVDLQQKLDIAVGKKLHAKDYLYHPVVGDNSLVVDLGSSVAFDVFIKEIDSFDVISNTELERVIESAQKKLKENGIEGTDYNDLLTKISSSIGNLVKTNTTLAIKVDDSNIIASKNSATIEEDRASIRAFFDEANTLYSLRDEFLKLEGETNNETKDVSKLETLKSQSEEASEALKQSKTAIRALSNVELKLREFVENAKVTGEKQTQDISSLFVGDSKSKLQGKIEFDANGASIDINGIYDQVTFSQVKASISTAEKNASFKLSGTLESPTAKLEITKGEVNASADLASAGLLLTDKAKETYKDKINAVQAALELTLTTKTSNPASFTGDVLVNGIRSTENYIKFVGDSAEPIFNLKTVTLKGSLSLAGNHIKLDMELTSPNAATFIPNHQTYEEGKVYKDIITYSYNGDDKFTLHTPNNDISYLSKNSDFNNLFVIEKTDKNSEEIFTRYLRSNFVETMKSRRFYLPGFRLLSISGADLKLGAHEIVKQVNGVPVTIKYNLMADKMTLKIMDDKVILDKAFTYNADKTAVVSTGFYARNININPNIHVADIGFISANHKDLVSFVKGIYLSFSQPKDGCYGNYGVDSSELMVGSDLKIVAKKQPWNRCPGAVESIVVSYSLTDKEFIFDTNNKVDQYKKYTLHSKTTSTRESVVRTKIYADGDKSIRMMFLNKNKAFIDLLNLDFKLADGCELKLGSRCNANWGIIRNIGDVNFGYENLEVGDKQGMFTLIREIDSADPESENNFRLFNVKANIEVLLNVLGTTNIAAEIQRIGYDDSIQSLSVKHSNLQKVESALTVLISRVGNKVDQFIITNSKGVSFNLKDYEKEGDSRTIKYGKETATVAKTKVGLKLTFSDGTFYTY